MKVMVVDDEQSLLRALELIFSNAGFEYIGICQSTKALEAIEDHRPDVVILDVMMPGINGFELCEAIRNRQPEMPILMLSAKCDIVDRHVGLRAGADDYLAKPFDDEELLLRVKALLRRAHRESTTPGSTPNPPQRSPPRPHCQRTKMRGPRSRQARGPHAKGVQNRGAFGSSSGAGLHSRRNHKGGLGRSIPRLLHQHSELRTTDSRKNRAEPLRAGFAANRVWIWISHRQLMPPHPDDLPMREVAGVPARPSPLPALGPCRQMPPLWPQALLGPMPLPHCLAMAAWPWGRPPQFLALRAACQRSRSERSIGLPMLVLPLDTFDVDRARKIY